MTAADRPKPRDKACLFWIAGISLVLIAVLSVGLPRYINTLQQSFVKRTMADIRAAATAVEAFQTDHGAYPVLGFGPIERLSPLLAPTYIKQVPTVDVWNKPIDYESDGTGYRIESLGKDPVRDPVPPSGQTTDFGADIIFEDGTFLSWPDFAVML